MDWDKSGLIRKANAVCRSKAQRNLFTTSHWLLSWYSKRGMRTKVKSSAAWRTETQHGKRTGCKARNGSGSRALAAWSGMKGKGPFYSLICNWKYLKQPPAPLRTGINSSCVTAAESLPWSFLCWHEICTLILLLAALFWTVLSSTATEVNGTVYMP